MGENGREEGDGKKIIFEREEERKKRKRVWLTKESMVNSKEGVGVGVCVSKKREEKKKEQELGSFFHFSPIQGKDFKVIPCLFLHSLLYAHTTTIPPSPLSLISFVPFYQLYSLSFFLSSQISPFSRKDIFLLSLSPLPQSCGRGCS